MLAGFWGWWSTRGSSLAFPTAELHWTELLIANKTVGHVTNLYFFFTHCPLIIFNIHLQKRHSFRLVFFSLLTPLFLLRWLLLTIQILPAAVQAGRRMDGWIGSSTLAKWLSVHRWVIESCSVMKSESLYPRQIFGGHDRVLAFEIKNSGK